MKRHLTLLTGVLAGVFLISAPVFAGDVYVIANNAMSVTADDVKDIFLGDKQVSAGAKITPLDNAAAQKDFLEKVMKMDANKYNGIWTKKGFRDGLNPPAVKSGDAEVVAAVKATPGAVGYVSSAPSGVKVVQKY